MSDGRQVSVLTTLTGASAFGVVQDVLRGEAVEPRLLSEPAFARLCSALDGTQGRPSPLDLAVLIRHALRYHALQQENGESIRTFVRDGDGWPTAEQWYLVGIDTLAADNGFWVNAQPWCPTWMPHVGKDGVDGAAAQAAERRTLQATPGDPFLAGLDREKYHSAGQRAAMRAALTTPPGATLLICLPTGEGKSLIFQAIAEYGFGDGESGVGVTLVITPTVALALDHQRAALGLGLPNQPRAYISGQDRALTNQLIVEHIADGTQGLCFASPEAVCGPLRSALTHAARGGRLRALVVDEAHLVDAWGGSFRSEFQILSGVRQDLLREQAAALAFRTILLSATITPQAESTLRMLFGTKVDGTPGQYAISAAARLRPEIEYWVAPLAQREVERHDRVLEAICHLPRPAILYTTEREDADRWYAELRKLGFRRVACLTGKTDNSERQSIIEGWQNNSIDLVVGTSAFGLGIDNPHVRTVIHACIPETLDRFYQEVGRGGRDGHASISLLIPTEYDRRTADGLNNPRKITVERGLQRWQAMFQHPDRKPLGDNIFTVRLDVPPGFSEDDIDMLSERNTDWNRRTLTLMATSGFITLLSAGLQSPLTYDPGDPPSIEQGEDSVSASVPSPIPPGVYQTIRINDSRHLDPDIWAQVIEPQRVTMAEASRHSLKRMLDFLKQTQCAADILAPQYELRSDQVVQGDAGLVQMLATDVHVARACGGCGYCRVSGYEPYSELAAVTNYPWPPLPAPHNLVDETNRLIIYYPPATHPAARASVASRAVRRRDQGALVVLLRDRIRNVIVLLGSGLDLVSVQKELPHWPLFCSDDLVLADLPPGPTLVIVPPGGRLTPVQLAPQKQEHARIFLLPEGFEDPTRPGIPLRESYGGREIEWDRWLRELYL
jgi:ATP-dependent DNA helicase RecQ